MIPQKQSSVATSINFQNSLNDLQRLLHSGTEAIEEGILPKKVLEAISFANTQAECRELANCLKERTISLRSEKPLNLCLEKLQIKEDTLKLDKSLTELQKELKKIQLFAQKSQEDSSFASVITKEDFLQDPIEVQYQDQDLETQTYTLTPYELFLLTSHSAVLSTSLSWSITNQRPLDIMMPKSVSEHIISALQGEVFSLSNEEQIHLLQEIQMLSFDQEGLKLLLPFYLGVLENRDLQLDDLADLSPLFLTTEVNLIYLLDKPLASALKQLSLENPEENLQENLKTISNLCWENASSLPLTNQELRKLFTPLVTRAIEQGTLEQNAFLQEISPPIRLEISSENMALLQNDFVKRCLFRARIKEGSKEFYLQVLTLLLDCKPEALKNFSAEDFDFFSLVIEEFNDNFDVVKAAVRQPEDDALRHASERLKDNPDIVKTAVRAYGNALQHASERLKDNPDIVKTAVLEGGYALQHASERLKDDLDIVKAAVRAYGFALQHASERLKDNFEIVRIAVQKEPGALQYASDRLKGDPEIIRAARSFR